jgi:hypothetical protein
MKYESLITCHSNDMANVKVFEKWVKPQGQGHMVKNFGTIRKILSKALSLAIQTIWPMLKFLQTDKQTDRRTGQKLYAPDLSIRWHKNPTQVDRELPDGWTDITHGSTIMHPVKNQAFKYDIIKRKIDSRIERAGLL